jgi:hypothetical protein
LVRVPEIIPLLLLAFAHSRRRADILGFLLSLGKYSLWNAFCLNIGKVHLLLLWAFYARFEYRGLSVEFELSLHFIKQQVVGLVAVILTVRSNLEVDHAICDLITPNKAGRFSANDRAEKIEFKCIMFDMPVGVVIDQCESASVPISEESPVVLGLFTLFWLLVKQHERDALIAGTHDPDHEDDPAYKCDFT